MASDSENQVVRTLGWRGFLEKCDCGSEVTIYTPMTVDNTGRSFHSEKKVPQLNKDSIVEILIRVAKQSERDAVSLGSASRQYNEALRESTVLRVLDLAEFVAKPQLLSDCSAFFNLALSAKNPVAAYLNGLTKITIDSDVEAALLSLNVASKAGHDSATLMLSMYLIRACHSEWGIQMLDMIEGWKSRLNYVHRIGKDVVKTLRKMGEATKVVFPTAYCSGHSVVLNTGRGTVKFVSCASSSSTFVLPSTDQREWRIFDHFLC